MLWIKSLHLFFVVAWFAGLFALPRLFVYHAQTPPDAIAQRETFQVMERKMLRFTSLNALLSLLFGIVLLTVWLPAYLSAGWMQWKLVLVLALLGYHGWCARIVRGFREERETHSHVWFRWFNEVPAFALIAIVILVIVKPG